MPSVQAQSDTPEAVLHVVNEYRASSPVCHFKSNNEWHSQPWPEGAHRELLWDEQLADAAEFHNQWMVDHHCTGSHQCNGEPALSVRVADTGYQGGAGENIAYRYFFDAQDVVFGDGSKRYGWAYSKTGHNENMLYCWYRAAGAGQIATFDPDREGDWTHYITMVFGTSLGTTSRRLPSLDGPQNPGNSVLNLCTPNLFEVGLFDPKARRIACLYEASRST